MSTRTAVACHDVRVCFDAFVALDQINLEVAEGATVALIGPNGAGKTTLLNALSGRIPMASGRVQLNGADITHVAVHKRVQQGLGRSFQIVNLFPEMTTLENLRLAGQPLAFKRQPWWRSIDAWDALTQKARDTAALVNLDDVLDIPVAKLSHGRQRAADLAVALMSNPSVLLLDEPLAGVGQAEMQMTLNVIARVRQGRTILLVEHNMDAVMRLADEIVVLTGGKVLMRGTPEEVQHDARVRRVYLGEIEIAHA